MKTNILPFLLFLKETFPFGVTFFGEPVFASNSPVFDGNLFLFLGLPNMEGKKFCGLFRVQEIIQGKVYAFSKRLLL